MFWIVSPDAVTRTVCPGDTVTGEIAARSIPAPDTVALATWWPSTVRVSVPEPAVRV
jgi:hypothetical protein